MGQITLRSTGGDSAAVGAGGGEARVAAEWLASAVTRSLRRGDAAYGHACSTCGKSRPSATVRLIDFSSQH